MMLVIGGVLDAAALDAIREAAGSMPFENGRATAGRAARTVKDNAQAAASPERDAVFRKVEAALWTTPLFLAAARPKRIARLLLSRYRGGQAYGAHVDDAFMGGARTDLSFTLFLSEPDDYEGGALVLEEPLEERSIRLGAGDMILYPSGALHRVEPVTAGERLAVVGWVTSRVRGAAEREVLFDLDRSIAELDARGEAGPLRDRITKARTNLLRLWGEE